MRTALGKMEDTEVGEGSGKADGGRVGDGMDGKGRRMVKR